MIRGKDAELFGKTTYQKWIESQGIPILREFYIEDIRKVELAPWAWKGGRGAYLNLIGTGETNDAYICEIPPGGSLKAQRLLFEELVFVVEGRGATTIWNDASRKVTFEWHAGSLFSPPLNTWRQHFNGLGSGPARLIVVTSAPHMLNLFHNVEFVLDNPYAFTDRFDGDVEYFAGTGKTYQTERTIQVWDTNFVSDVRAIPLPERRNRGAGGRYLGLELSENSMTAHISEFPVGTYKKAHRHGPGAHVVIIGGQGYSLMWPEGEEIQRFDWHDGSVVVPPERWFHQHFNTGTTPARYLALRWHSRKYGTGGKRYGTSESVKAGGDQIEYEDEDPKVRRMFEDELAKQGIASGMAAVIAAG